MSKIEYGVLALQLETLYSVPIDPNDNLAVEEHCEMIARFIEDAGWDVDDFTRESLKEFLLPDLSKMN